jgi:hypothetical protein
MSRKSIDKGRNVNNQYPVNTATIPYYLPPPVLN